MSDKLQKNYGSPRWTGEITDCSLPVTFDTYSNCSFGCVYCFSQYQRGIGKGKEEYFKKEVKSVNPERIKKLFTNSENNQFWEYLKTSRPIQWGGLSDQFDGFEKQYGITLEILKFLREINYPICFSTKAAWVFFDDRYRELFKGADNWNMKFSIITLNEEKARKIEVGVPTPGERLAAMKEYSQLSKGGCTLRLRPFIIGVSSEDYLELIERAAEAGATAVTTEFFCMETRAINQAREHYKIISDCCGFDIVDFYKKYSRGAGYLRLNRKVKEPYIRRMQEKCKELGLRFYVSDAHFKEVSDNGCCCALPPDWNYSRGNFSYALQLCRRQGKVCWSDIEKDMYFLDTFQWRNAQGFNCNSSEKRAMFDGMTMKDYLRYLWNNPTQGQSPYLMFGGVMKPNGIDEDGNIIYVYDQSKTYQKCGHGCNECTSCGFYDVVEEKK